MIGTVILSLRLPRQIPATLPDYSRLQPPPIAISDRLHYTLNVNIHHTPDIGMRGRLEQRIVFRHVFALLGCPARRFPVQPRLGRGFGHAGLAGAFSNVHVSNKFA
jgi:hypothetical protein